MSSISGDARELLEGFAEEAIGGLRELPAQLAQYRSDPRQAEPINAVFRAVHSLKGNAGFFGLTQIKLFAHKVENTLDEIRTEKRPVSGDLERTLIEAFDRLDELVNLALEGACEEDLTPIETTILEHIARYANSDAPAPSTAADRNAALVDLAAEMMASGLPEAVEWAQRLESLAVDEASDEVAEASADNPAAQRMTAEQAASAVLTWNGEDVSARLQPAWQLFVDFAQGRYTPELAHQWINEARTLATWCQETGIAQLATALERGAADLQTITSSQLEMDANLLAIIWEPLADTLAGLIASSAAAAPAPAPEAAAVVPASDAAPAATAGVARTAEAASRAEDSTTSQRARFIRVREERIDEFLGSVSSLFITAEMLKDLQIRMAESRLLPELVDELQQANRTLSAQSKDLQKAVVSLRQVSVSGLFSKFPKMARTLAGQLGKQIEVHVSGEEIEIDKSLVEDLDAPLTHMIRNVVDHGIEMPADRQSRGASETGNLWLRAEESRTHVSIIVQDDGRGVDPVKVREKAVSKGLLTRAQADAISDDEAAELIFLPGFSTAEKLSEISGRGVGLDVVRTAIREHNGEVTVKSRKGQGTTFRLDVPRRNAVVVIDGLMIRHAEQQFVVPFEFIREIVELEPHELSPVQGGQVARIRGEVYAAISLGKLLGLPDRSRDAGGRRPGVLVGRKQETLCLLTDSLLGHRQVVVNQLAELVHGEGNISGVAPLGGGRMALVLSVADLLKSARTQQ